MESGWDGRIRTYDTLYQKQLPYHLATSQQWGANYARPEDSASPENRKNTGLTEIFSGPKHLLVNLVFAREFAGFDFRGVFFDCFFDHAAEVAENLNKFWCPRVKSKHIFQNQNLTIAFV